MSTPQSGILPEGSSAALFLTLTLAPNSTTPSEAREGIRAVPRLTAELSAQHPSANLVSVVAIGADCWDVVIGEPKPGELRPFFPLENGGRSAPATEEDIFVHIRSSRPDLNYLLATHLMAAFGKSVERVEEITGFRYLDNRDLTGFVDGTENPEGEERPRVALVGEGDPAFSGGSFVHIQRYEHRMENWQKVDVAEQERVIGRTKVDNVEMEDDLRPPTAHISRVDIKVEHGKQEILRHSMPYGDTSRAGLYFVAYGASPAPFENMLKRMILADDQGHFDHLLKYTRAVTGAAFFAPSLEFLSTI